MGIFRSIDAGASWDRINNQIDDYSVAGWNLAFHPTNPNKIYFTTTRGVFRTYDAGDNWECFSIGLPDSTAFWSIEIDPVNPSCLYIYHTQQYGFYRTMDGGNSWQDISMDPYVHRPQVITSDPFQAGHVIASCFYGRVYESFNYGSSWTEIINQYPTLYYVFGDIIFDPFNPGVIFGAIGSGNPAYDGIYRSDDNGQNWTKWDISYPAFQTFDLKMSCIDSSRLYAVLDRAGVYVSNDRGKTWTPQNSGIENLDSYMITTVPEDGDERLYYCTQTGVYTTLLLTGISEDHAELPVKFVLKQNYPNPFNPSTAIEFSIPNSEFVTLKIYNLLGREIASLVSEKLMPGNYKYSWDASEFASGIYYYKIKAGSFLESKKLLLIK